MAVNLPEETSPKVDDRIANMDESVALPRSNGELLFESPWEARAFGLAVALNESGAYAWNDFSQGLARKIASEEASANAIPTTYYERWLATLESLVVANGLVTPAEIEAMMAQQALLDDHDHDHEHHDHHHHDHDHDDHHHHDHQNSH